MKHLLYFYGYNAILFHMSWKNDTSITLDRFDISILDILMKDNMTPQRQIAEAVNLSAAAVQRRIKKMTLAGVIHSNIAIVNPLTVGLPITLIVEIELIDVRNDIIEEAKKRLLNMPVVQQCYYVTGQADFFLILHVATMADYENFSRNLFFTDPNVKKIRTSVAIDSVKVGHTLALK